MALYYNQGTQNNGAKTAEVPVSIGVKTTEREINPTFEYDLYNGTLEVDGAIIDLEPIIATANDSDTILYSLMGKCKS